jgi:hypothetical protein
MHKINSIKTSKGIVYLATFAVLTVLTILVPEILREEAVGRVNPPAKWPVYLTVWTYSLPIFFALYQTVKLINLIEIKKAFSQKAVGTLGKIKYAALAFCVMVIIGTITGVLWGRRIDPTEDYAPLSAMGIIFTFISSVITAFLAILQRLLQNAIDIKSENDLTV